LSQFAYQTKDILDAMQADTGIQLKELNADGGVSANSFQNLYNEATANWMQDLPCSPFSAAK